MIKNIKQKLLFSGNFVLNSLYQKIKYNKEYLTSYPSKDILKHELNFYEEQIQERTQLKFDNSIRVYENIESFFLENINDCIYVAGSPELNFKAVNLAIKNKIPLILEKPISNNSQNLEKIQFLTNKYKLIIIPNLTNYFSDSFNYLKNYVDKNFDQIKFFDKLFNLRMLLLFFDT